MSNDRVPAQGKNDSQTDDVTVVGDAPIDTGEVTTDSVEKYELKTLKETDYVQPGLITLEVVAEGSFISSTGEVLRTGDRKVVSTVDSNVLLDAKVNGKPAFKSV